MLKSSKTNTLGDGLIEEVISVIDKIASKTKNKKGGGLIEETEVRHLSI